MKFSRDEQFNEEMEREILGVFLQLKEYFEIEEENPNSNELPIRKEALKETVEEIKKKARAKAREQRGNNLISFPKRK